MKCISKQSLFGVDFDLLVLVYISSKTMLIKPYLPWIQSNSELINDMDVVQLINI